MGPIEHTLCLRDYIIGKVENHVLQNTFKDVISVKEETNKW